MSPTFDQFRGQYIMHSRSWGTVLLNRHIWLIAIVIVIYDSSLNDSFNMSHKRLSQLPHWNHIGFTVSWYHHAKISSFLWDTFRHSETSIGFNTDKYFKLISLCNIYDRRKASVASNWSKNQTIESNQMTKLVKSTTYFWRVNFDQISWIAVPTKNGPRAFRLALTRIDRMSESMFSNRK